MRIVYNPDALYDVRRDPAVIAAEEELAQEIADACNAWGKGTFATSSVQGRRDPQGRWRTTVITADAYAIRANAKHNILIREMP